VTLARLKVAVDGIRKAHQRRAKSGKNASPDYKVLLTPAYRPEGAIGAGTD
jgi:hypothetical protein